MIYGFSDINDVRRIDRTVNAYERNRGGRPAHATPPRVSFYPRIGVYNDSGNTIPPFGLGFFKGAEGQHTDTGEGPAQGKCAKLKQPDAFGCQNNCVVTDEGIDGTGIANAAFGAAQIYPPFIAAYDNADGTPAFGESWGPRSGTYLLKKNTGGFRVLGVYDATNHYALVWPEPLRRILVKNLTGSDIAKGATNGVVTIMTGTPGAETSTGITISNVLSRWGTFKNNAIGDIVLIETTLSSTPAWEINNTDTC